MNRVIRIPNKVLIIAALILVVGGTAFTWGGDDALFAGGKALEAQGLAKESYAVYQALVSTFGDSEYRAEALVRMAQLLPPHSEGYFDASYLPSWSIPPGQLHLWFFSQTFVDFNGADIEVWDHDETVTRKISHLKSALNADLDATWEPRALAELGYAKAALGDYEAAAPLLAKAGQYADYRAENPWVAIWLGRTYRHLNQLDKAEVVLREALETPTSLEKEIRLELADVLESRGLFRAALEQAQTADALEGYRLRSFLGDYLSRTSRLERTLTYLEGEHRAVAGEITLNGEGLPGVRVILHKGHESESTSSWFSPPQMIAQAVTDVNGYFELFDLESGHYGVNYMIPMQLAAESSVESTMGSFVDVREGETAWVELDFDSRFVKLTRAEIEDAEPYPLVHLAWEEVPGAGSYFVRAFAGGAGVMPWGDEGFVFEGTTATIPLDPLFRHLFKGGNAFSGSPGKGQLVLPPILGFRHPDSMLDFQVQALDQEGNPLGRSRVICPVTCGGDGAQDRVELEPPRPDLSEADMLLLERRYEEAIAMYEREHEADPYDYHTLLMLWHFAASGIDEARTHKDPERALDYGERLMKLAEHDWHRQQIEEWMAAEKARL